MTWVVVVSVSKLLLSNLSSKVGGVGGRGEPAGSECKSVSGSNALWGFLKGKEGVVRSKNMSIMEKKKLKAVKPELMRRRRNEWMDE